MSHSSGDVRYAYQSQSSAPRRCGDPLAEYVLAMESPWLASRLPSHALKNFSTYGIGNPVPLRERISLWTRRVLSVIRYPSRCRLVSWTIENMSDQPASCGKRAPDIFATPSEVHSTEWSNFQSCCFHGYHCYLRRSKVNQRQHSLPAGFGCTTRPPFVVLTLAPWSVPQQERRLTEGAINSMPRQATYTLGI
jgi:hypothetical protein